MYYRDDVGERWIVGDGDQFESLRRRTADLGLTERVSFEGWVDNSDLPRYYCGADLFVHPGRWPEPFGRTLLESLCCETPAVVSDIGGPPWVVEEAGETFPVERADALADRLQSLRDDADRLADLRSACRPRLSHFAPDRVLDLMEMEYRRARE
jgi:glycosyltransferase involved in cell wall biosynthesis